MNLVPLFEEALEFQNYNGSVLSNGKVAVFYIGRTRLADIFNDIEGLSPAENPKVLDNLGMGPLYVNPAFDYELIVYDAYDNEMFSVKKYLHSKGEHSTANVVVTPSENIAVSAWTQGDVQVYMPYLTGDVGKIYEGIDPIVVNNEYNRISANHIPLGVQEPLYFVEDSESACILGCSAQTEIPSALSSKWNEASDAVMANSAQWAEGTEYKAGSYVDITDNTISVTGLQPEGDYAYNSALSSKLDVTALPQDLVHNGDLTAYQPAGNYQTAGNYLSATDSAKFYPMEGNPSGFINELPSDLATTGFVADVSANITAIIPTGDSNTISYSAKPTDNPIYASANNLNNVDGIQGKSNLAIIPNGVLQVPNVITAVPNGVLNVPGVIISHPGGLTANGLSANANGLSANGLYADTIGLSANGLSANTYGLTANGLTADVNKSGFSANGISVGKSGPLSIEGQHESIYANNATGFTFSSQNTAFGTAQLGIAQGNSVVQMYAPKLEARNISGAGFSIEASGAKGYNESGNVVWDTNNPQVKNIISYADTKTAQGGLTGNIILTTQPSTNASNLTSSPYVVMDANQASYFAAYGPSAQTPTVSLMPSNIMFAYQAGNAKTTVGYNDVKQESGGSSWTLTGSIQKRELEYDANTSAITAIAGSAIGGQGGGGGSVSSKYGTISVEDSNIEATNKAIKFNSKGFRASFADISLDEYNPPRSITWDNYSQGTTLTFNVLNGGNSDPLAYSSNTNVTGLITAAQYTPTDVSLPIPNATAIQFSANHIYTLQSIRVSAASSFKVSELAWKSDLPTYTYNSDHKVRAINGNELVGNEDYLLEQGFVQNLTSPKGTVSVLNNNKIEGTNSAIASDVIEGFVSSYNGVSVYPGNSATLTWDRYVPNTMLFVSGTEYQEHTLTYSANTNVTGVITTTTAGQISIELPTDSTSIVIGNEDWSITAYNFAVSAENYYEIGELAWASALPTFEYDNTNKISAINGSAIAGGGQGGELPEAVSAATDYVTANSANIDATISNVSANSGAWGGSALPISAGKGIKFELVNNTLVASVTSTYTSGYVWQSASLFHTDTPVTQTTYTLSDNCSNYDRLDVDFYDINNWRTVMECPIPSNLDASGTRGGYFSVVPASTATNANIWFKAFNWTAANNTWTCYCSELAGQGGSTNQTINANQPENPPKVVNIIGWKRVGGN